MRPIQQLVAAAALSVCVLISPNAMATAQAPDVIIVDGKEESLNTNPLSKYLAANPKRLPESDIRSTGNWRGYIATWEVLDGRLCLKKVEVEFRDKNPGKDEYRSVAKDVTDQLFSSARPIVATWYSGALVVPKGDLVSYVHMGYGSTYEKYTIFTVADGNVLRRLDLSSAQFKEYRDSQFKAYKLTSEYAARFKETKSNRSEPESDKFVEDFLYSFDSEHYLSIDFSNGK